MRSDVGYKRPPGRPKKIPGTLSPTDRKVLYYLTDMADRLDTRTVQIFTMDIARALGMIHRKVQDALTTLRRFEYIAVEPTMTKYGKGASKYTILNPDQTRRDKIKQASDVSGIPVPRIVEYVHKLIPKQNQLKKKAVVTVGDIAYFAGCPGEDAAKLVQGLAMAGILRDEGEIEF